MIGHAGFAGRPRVFGLSGSRGIVEGLTEVFKLGGECRDGGGESE